MKDWDWKLLITLTLGVLLLSALYCFVLYQNEIIPLGGKKAPTYVFLLVAQWYLVKDFSKKNTLDKLHFLKLFAYQYFFVFWVALTGSLLLRFFYEIELGQGILRQFILQSIAEIQQYSPQIESREGKQYLIDLVQGVQGISPGSIAKDEFFQKIALAFLPNLLISLYYKRM